MSVPHRSRTELAQVLAEKNERVRLLEADCKRLQKEALDARVIRREIFKLADAKPELPGWMLDSSKAPSKGPGIPVAVASDWHWGERISPEQIGGVNKYNIEIAHARAKAFFSGIITLLKNYMVKPEYEGIVLCLGGDMLSGNIHEELAQTNELQTMPAMLDLYGVLVEGIDSLLKEFGSVVIPCVTGNHGRNTLKMQAKERCYTSFDWLLYQMLEKHYEKNKKVRFLISGGVDQLFKVYNHRFLLTHGDSLGKGGDGIIGCLGPVIRGDSKTRSRNGQIGQEYDTMLIGHYHQLMFLSKVIINGCFPAGSLVTCGHSHKPIEEVNVGDTVLSHDGTWNTVTNKLQKMSDEGLIHLKIRGLAKPLTCTPNHMLWAIKGQTKKCAAIGVKWDALQGDGDKPQWIPADYISPEDFVSIPVFNGGGATPITPDLAWAYGLYIAEGHALVRGGAKGLHNRVALTMHDRELPVLEKFAKIMAENHPELVDYRVYTRTRSNGGLTSEYVCSGKNIAAWFRDQFGHLAIGKQLPEWMLDMTPELKRCVVQGWIDGDGHTSKRDSAISVTTISPVLAHQMFDMAMSCGLNPSLMTLAKGGPRKNDSYSIWFRQGQESIVVDGVVFNRVNARYRDTQVVPVYDLEVSGPHTYTVNHCGVHNSLCGYNEFASNMLRAPFEVPRQALFCVHPEHGITYQMPILVEPHKVDKVQKWVSWTE